MKLTLKNIGELRLDGRTDLIVFDERLPGFGFRLRRSHDGKREMRTWILQTKREGRTNRMKLGSAEAGAMSADAAREKARKLLNRIADGEDPQAAKRERAAKNKRTLGALIETYLEHKQVKPHTLMDLRRYLNLNFKPLHAIPVDRVSRQDIAARLVAIQGESGDIVAAKARAAMSGLFVWSMQMGLVEANPVIGTRKPSEGEPRERVLSDDELCKIWLACNSDDDYSRVIRLLILLGARRQEVGGMAWPELTLDGPQPSWTLPAARSKNGKAHKLPLMPMALAIVRSVPRMATRDLLFGARAPSGLSGWARAKAALDQRCGITESWTVHDLRRSTATGMADIGIAPHIIEHILNHRSGHKSGIAGVYNRSPYERETRAALAMWEDHIRTLVDGGARKVIPLPFSS
jgi:integrase